jgi:hypothetical protein
MAVVRTHRIAVFGGADDPLLRQPGKGIRLRATPDIARPLAYRFAPSEVSCVNADVSQRLIRRATRAPALATAVTAT